MEIPKYYTTDLNLLSVYGVIDNDLEYRKTFKKKMDLLIDLKGFIEDRINLTIEEFKENKP